MIITITLNPSVDICYYLVEFKSDDINRCSNYIKTAGGKGINVSKVLRDLGCEVVATGFLGGGTGQFIEKEINKMSIHSNFVEIQENTRNCIAIISNGTQTEILEDGPNITEKESENFIQLISDVLDNHNIKVVSASGSIPKGLDKNYYNRIIEIAKKRNVKFVLDTSGEYLKEAIKSSPYLIKPNISELEALLNVKIQSEKDLILAMYKLKAYNIEMIVVSLGKDGCIALCGNEIYKVTIPRVKVKNPVGSGDAMVAGMVKEIENNSTYEEILRVGNTCGILNAINEETGSIDMGRYKAVYNEIKITILKS